MIRALIYASALLATTAAAAPFNEACQVPERKVATVQVVDEGYGTKDPRPYSRGWMSMRAVSDRLIQPWGGNIHSPDSDNSIRRYDVATDTWEIIHPNVGELYKGGSTTDIWPDKAYSMWGNPDPPYILDGRDNGLYFYIPDRREMLIYGAPSKGNSWGGVYSLDSERWTHMWRQLSAWGTQGYFKPYSVPKGNENYAWSYNAAHVWVDPDGPGGDVGKGLAFGGARFSSFKSELFLIEPSEESDYVFKYRKIRSARGAPPAMGNNRNGVIAAGRCAYFFGGALTRGGMTDQVWRYNTASGEWLRVASMPVASAWNAAAYDPATNRVVVVTGDNPTHVLVYDLEADRWSDVTDQLPAFPNRVHQPMLAHAYGRYVLMARAWDDGDNKSHWTDAGRLYRFIVAAKTYDRPKIKKVYGPDGPGEDSFNKWPAKFSKHVSWEWNPINKRYYSGGGDFSGTPFRSSYRQEIYSYEPATNTWRKEHPYCVPDGEISWHHPDPIGWYWDAKREVFWFTPGLMPMKLKEQHCKKGKYYKWQMLTFDPKTKKFSRPKQPPPEQYPGNDIPGSPKKYGLGEHIVRYSALIEDDSKIFRIGRKKVAIFTIADGTWELRDHNGEDFGNQRFQLSMPVVVGKDVYLRSRDGGLFRYNLDAQRLYLVDRHPPGGTTFIKRLGHSLVSYPAWTAPKQQRIWMYNLITGTWASTAPIRNTVTSDDPELIECTNYNDSGCFGTSWEISRERKEMLVFAEQRHYRDPYDHFYLIDLSFLADPSPGAGEPISAWPKGAASTPTSQARSRKAKKAKTKEERNSSSPARSSKRKRRSTTAVQEADPPPPAPPADMLPPAGQVRMKAGAGEAYNLPERSRFRENAFDAGRTAEQD